MSAIVSLILGPLAMLLVLLALAIPGGRMIEYHTRQRALNWLFRISLAFFAVVTTVGMYGLAEVSDNVARIESERRGPSGDSGSDDDSVTGDSPGDR